MTNVPTFLPFPSSDSLSLRSQIINVSRFFALFFRSDDGYLKEIFLVRLCPSFGQSVSLPSCILGGKYEKIAER